jgi:hypothetical protein
MDDKLAIANFADLALFLAQPVLGGGVYKGALFVHTTMAGGVTAEVALKS